MIPTYYEMPPYTSFSVQSDIKHSIIQHTVCSRGPLLHLFISYKVLGIKNTEDVGVDDTAYTELSPY